MLETLGNSILYVIATFFNFLTYIGPIALGLAILYWCRGFIFLLIIILAMMYFLDNGIGYQFF